MLIIVYIYICSFNFLNIHFTLFPIYQRIIESEIGFKAPVFRIFLKNALSLIKKGVGLVKHDNLFDFVVGNPPYLFIRDIPSDQRLIIENSAFKTNKGQYDYYQIFIELGIKLLKNQGKLGYIVPDSILALSNRLIIRKFIYNTTKIKEIYYTGPKFNDPVVSNIILILEKENNNLERKKNTIRTKLSDLQENQILQEALNKWDFKFLIHLNDIDISIIEHLNNNFPKLKDLNKKIGFKLSVCRGVELAKTGEIIYCNRCEMYFPVPKKHLLCPECKSKLKIENLEKIIRDEIPDDKKEDFKSFLYSINRYQIKNNKYIDISKNGINYKDLNIYKDRIIIRQLSQNNLICATYDTNFSLTSQSFYNLKIHQSPIREFNHYYVLALINSKLLSFYFIKSFGSYKKLFPRILIEKIKTLPLKIPESPEERKIAIEIIEYVKKLLELNDKNQRIIGDTQDKIDSLVFDLYQISNDHREHISNFMNKL
ncbi:MAG: Eco57I restriction-modification methylase domain-containing protein [Promethearchaeota archaeon]